MILQKHKKSPSPSPYPPSPSLLPGKFDGFPSTGIHAGHHQVPVVAHGQGGLAQPLPVAGDLLRPLVEADQLDLGNLGHGKSMGKIHGENGEIHGK